MSADGHVIVVGSPSEQAFRVFDRSAGGVWTMRGAPVSPPGISGTNFGYSLACDASCDKVVVGARPGLFFAFYQDGNWTFDQPTQTLSTTYNASIADLGARVCMSSDGLHAVVLNPNDVASYQDTFQHYAYNGTAWVFVRYYAIYIENPSAEVARLYSASISHNGSVLALGAPDSQNGQGQVLVYRRTGDFWAQTEAVYAPDAASRLGAGNSLALSPDASHLAFSADMPVTFAGVRRGTAFLYAWSGSDWVLSQEPVPDLTYPVSREAFFAYCMMFNSDATRLVFSLATLNTNNYGVFTVWTRLNSSTSWTNSVPSRTTDDAFDAYNLGISCATSADGSTAAFTTRNNPNSGQTARLGTTIVFTDFAYTHSPTPPTASPSASPTAPTTQAPTQAPNTLAPTTLAPTLAPTTLAPTARPTTLSPTAPTTRAPTLDPTHAPTHAPTFVATELRLSPNSYMGAATYGSMFSDCASAGAGFLPFLSYIESGVSKNMRDLVLNPLNPVVGPTGIRIADSVADLFGGTLLHTLSTAGVCSSSSQEFWTGSLPNGTLDDDSCYDPGITTSWSGGDFDNANWDPPYAVNFGGCDALSDFAVVGGEVGPDACGSPSKYVLCYKESVSHTSQPPVPQPTRAPTPQPTTRMPTTPAPTTTAPTLNPTRLPSASPTDALPTLAPSRTPSASPTQRILYMASKARIATRTPTTSNAAIDLASANSSDVLFATWPAESPTSSGALYVYDRTGDAWTQRGSAITPSTLGSACNWVNCFFGASVASDSNGSFVAVGASDEANAALTTQPGAVYALFSNGAGGWTVQKITPSTFAGAWAKLGASVAMSSAGEYMVAGAPEDDSGKGRVWFYSRNGTTWSETTSFLRESKMGLRVSMNAAGNVAVASGSFASILVDVYTRAVSTWSLATTLSVDAYGVSTLTLVRLDSAGSTLVVLDQNLGAYVLTGSGASWTLQAGPLYPTNPAPSGALSWMHVRDDVLAMSRQNQGVWVYKRNGGGAWTENGEARNTTAIFTNSPGSRVLVASSGTLFAASTSSTAQGGGVWAFLD
jgi:hypothetical protein